MASSVEDVRRAIEAARAQGNEDDASALEQYLSQLESATGEGLSGPALNPRQRENRIAQYEDEYRDITVPKNRGSGFMGVTSNQLLSDISGEPEDVFEDREVPQPPIDPSGRVGQSLTQLEVGTKGIGQRYFQRKDDAIDARKALWEVVYSQLPETEKKRLSGKPKHWGWEYDDYKNMPFLDFVQYIEKGGMVTRDDIKGILGEDQYMQLLKGEHPTQEGAGMFYEYFVQPLLSSEEGLKPSAQLALSMEKAQKNWLTDQTRESLAKPWTAQDATWYKPWSWFDETTKAPWEDFDGFYYSVMENVPNLAMSYIGARGGGRAAAGLTKYKKFDSIENLSKAQQKLAGLGGAVGGGATEALLIRDATYQQTQQKIMELPQETWDKYPVYQDMIENGITPEHAKQIISFEVAKKAGDVAAVTSGLLLGSPMGWWFGQRAAGKIAKEGVFKSMVKSQFGEFGQEGAQGMTEQLVSNMNVQRIDPNQDITEGLLESGVGEAMSTLGPGALMGAASTGGAEPAGMTKADQQAAAAVKDIKDAINTRYKFEQDLTKAEEDISMMPTQERVENFRKFEELQEAEAQTILDKAKTLREYMKENPSAVDRKMLDRLEMKANATLSSIEAARSKRTTLAKQLIEEQDLYRERENIEQKVRGNLMKLEDVERQLEAIQAVQNQEQIDSNMYDELRREGYGGWVGPNENRFIIKPKGKRAAKELARQARDLRARIEAGYTGDERRKNDRRREAIEMMTPQQREQALYTDSLTGVKSRRAFKERVQNIDEKDPEKRGPSKARVVAAVDVDGLGWVNDNMTHGAGDRLLMAVAAEIDQEGVDVYRVGGDEFVVTGYSPQQVEAVLQRAAKNLQNREIGDTKQSVTPQITWAMGADYDQADAAATKMKQDRVRRGKIAPKKEKPNTWRAKDQLPLFQYEGKTQGRKGGAPSQWLAEAIKAGDVKVGDPVEVRVQTMRVVRAGQPQYLDVIGGTVTKIGGFPKNSNAIIQVETSDGSVLHFNSNNHLTEKGDVQSEIGSNKKLDRQISIMRNFKGRGYKPSTASIKIASIASEREANIEDVRFQGGEKPWSMSQSGEGDLYIRRHGRAAGDVSAERTSDNDIAITFDKERLLPDYMKYTFEYLKPQFQARLRGTAQQFITQKDVDEVLTEHFMRAAQVRFDDEYLPTSFRQIRDIVSQGDVVEILTPEGAIFGIITSIKGGKRPRWSVVADGRDYVFNPDRNWLIVRPETDPADIEYLVGDDYIQDGPTIREVQIGHVGNDYGEWYADLGRFDQPSSAGSYDPYTGWWENQYPEWSKTVAFLPEIQTATKEDMAKAMKVVDSVIADYENLPPINIVGSLEELEAVAPDTVREARAQGYSLRGIKGWFDETRPDVGIVVIVPNIDGQPGTERFENNLKETVFHELIGHYGVRGLFGNDIELRHEMLKIYHAPEFERIRNSIRAKVKRPAGTSEVEYRQLVGEEMVAYITGEVLSGNFKPTKKQKSLLQRFFDWVRSWFRKKGITKTYGQSLDQAKTEFWTDERIMNLVARSQDFVRNGKNFEYLYRDGRHVKFIRDGEMFRWGVTKLIDEGMESLSKGQRKQLAQKKEYGGDIANVPKEVPLFPEEASPAQYQQIVTKALKDNKITAKELELTYLDPNGEWSFLRDATYNDIWQFSRKNDHDLTWYKGIVPKNIEKMIDDGLGYDFIGPKQHPKDFDYYRRESQAITDALNETIDPTKTRLTKDILLRYLDSQKVVRVYAKPRGGHNVSYDQVVKRLYGQSVEAEDLSEDQMEVVRAEKNLIEQFGWDIGYDEMQRRWMSRLSNYQTDYSELMPQGIKVDANTYEIVFLKQEGGGLEVGRHAHFGGEAGVVAHMRIGTAELAGIDLPAPNPEWNNKAVALGELQSDWLTQLRASWPSEQDYRNASIERDALSSSLAQTTKDIVDGVGSQVIDEIKAKLRPALNLPEGTMRRELEANIRQRYGEFPTETQKTEAYVTLRNDLVDNVISDIDQTIQLFDPLVSQIETFSELPGSFDARMYDRLDQYAVRKMASNFQDGLLKLKRVLAEAKTRNVQHEFVAYLGDLLKISKQFGTARRWASESGSQLPQVRVPFAANQLNDFLERVYDGMNISHEKKAEIFSLNETRERALFTINRQAFDEAHRQMGFPTRGAAVSSHDLLSKIFGTENLAAAGFDSLHLSTQIRTSATGDSYEIMMHGSKSVMDQIRQEFGNILSSYIKREGPIEFRATDEFLRQRALRRARRSEVGNGDLTDPDWITVRDELDFEELDVDYHDDPRLREYSIQTLEDFEEGDHYFYTLDNIIDDAFNNMDWDGIYNNDGDGLWTGSDAYEDRITEDEDGDQDYSDADEWLDEARDAYRRDEMPEDDTYREMASDRIREEFYEDPPMLMLAELPVAWDEDGDPSGYVTIALIQEDHEGVAQIHIDGSDVSQDFTNKQDLFNEVPNAIAEYYSDSGITPPAGALFGPPVEGAPRRPYASEQGEAIDETMPSFTTIAQRVAGSSNFLEGTPQRASDMFERLVAIDKKLANQRWGVPDSPLLADKYWRTMALRYLLSDAVRKGAPGIVWHGGMATSIRGGRGAGLDEVASVKRIEWSAEQIEIAGTVQDVFIIKANGISDMVVSKQYAVSALGSDVLAYIQRQQKGELPAIPPRTSATGEVERPSLNDYIVSQAGRFTFVYRRDNHELVGTAQSADEAQIIIESDISDREEMLPRTPPQQGEALEGEVIPAGQPMKGVVTEEAIGGPIHLIVGRSTPRYRTWQKVPLLAGARESYERITPKIWEKELRKYGAKIENVTVLVNSIEKAKKEGGRERPVGDPRETAIREQHGNVGVVEATGETHGWVVLSERNGPLTTTMFSSKEDADRYLENWKEDNFGRKLHGIEVNFIRINDKIREEFSGPVPPFHYDPEQDPAMESVNKKIGFEKPTLRERVQKIRSAARAEFQQGMFDRFYGIKYALAQTQSDMGPYISTRLTTSLDSQVKAALEYGYPVWREGIMQTEGKGLLEILKPVAGNVDVWGRYMVGQRSKRLLMEGYDELSPDDKRTLANLAMPFDGTTTKDRVFNMLSYVTDPTDPASKISRRKFLQGSAAAATVVGKGMLPSMPDFVDKPTTAIERRAKEMFLHWLKSQRLFYKWLHGGQTAAQQAEVDRIQDEEFEYMQEVTRIGGIPRAQQTEQEMVEQEAYYESNYQIENLANEVEEKGFASLEEFFEEEARRMYASSEAQQKARKESTREEYRNRDSDVHAAINRLLTNGREKLFLPYEIDAMVRLGDKYPVFGRVASEYAEFNKKLLDFAEESGVINPETRLLWEHADYIPFYRIKDERLMGPLAPTAGIAGQAQPIRRLRGGEVNIGDPVHNIMVNLTKLLDASVKNNAALETIDELIGTGMVTKIGPKMKTEMIPMSQLKKILTDRGMDPNQIPPEALDGLQKMFAVTPPEGQGIIPVLRKGKREYYQTSEDILYRAMLNINKQHFGEWMALFRAPKRFLTTAITLDPGFMVRNFNRDTTSAFVLSRDHFIPVAHGIQGFAKALAHDKDMRTLISAGAAFESGYINQYDPKATSRMIKKHMKSQGFSRTVLSTPAKLLEAWKAIGSATENANRIAVYMAARRAGKSVKQSSYEAKDLMDFSMGGDWPVIQFLIQTVPFMGARVQGLHRLGRGAVENPVSFTMKGLLLSIAGMALWFAFREDERYKKLEEWDKDGFYHWWIGDNHYRLPKGFEVGAIFNTIPERMFEYMYSQENDAGKLLMRRYGFMLAETFNMSPIPQTIAPIVEMQFNHNFFTGRYIVNPYEQKRLPPEQYRHWTSPTMVELARMLPSPLDTASTKIRSPLHLQNLYHGYTGTLGKYVLWGSDWLIRQYMDYPLPPTRPSSDIPVYGDIVRGQTPRPTKYQEEFYRLMDKTNMVQGSLSFLENTEQGERLDKIIEEYEPYVRVADSLESIRQDVSDINRAQQQIYMDFEMSPDQKRQEIDMLELQKQQLFKEGYKLRPGGEENPNRPVTREDVIGLIERWGVDDSVAYQRSLEENAPSTQELLEMIQENMEKRQLESLARIAKN